MKKFIVVISVIFCMGCENKNIIYTSFHDITESTWSFKDSLMFEWEIVDTAQSYSIDINLRHSISYKWSNIYLFSDLIFPNEKARRDTFEYYFTDDYGHWTGNRSGLIVKNNFPLYKRVKFPLKGHYKLFVNQAMRDTLLNDLLSVGVQINKLP